MKVERIRIRRVDFPIIDVLKHGFALCIFRGKTGYADWRWEQEPGESTVFSPFYLRIEKTCVIISKNLCSVGTCTRLRKIS